MAKTTKEKLATLTEKERYEIYIRLFNTEDGELVLEDLKQIGMIGKAMFDKDPNKMYFLLGRQSVIADVLGVSEMTKEQLDELTEVKDGAESYDPNAE